MRVEVFGGVGEEEVLRFWFFFFLVGMGSGKGFVDGTNFYACMIFLLPHSMMVLMVGCFWLDG